MSSCYWCTLGNVWWDPDPFCFFCFCFLAMTCIFLLFQELFSCPTLGTKQRSNCHRMTSLKLWARRNLFFFLFCKLTSSNTCDSTAHLIRLFPRNAFIMELFRVFSTFNMTDESFFAQLFGHTDWVNLEGYVKVLDEKWDHEEYCLWRKKSMTIVRYKSKIAQIHQKLLVVKPWHAGDMLLGSGRRYSFCTCFLRSFRLLE